MSKVFFRSDTRLNIFDVKKVQMRLGKHIIIIIMIVIIIIIIIIMIVINVICFQLDKRTPR